MTQSPDWSSEGGTPEPLTEPIGSQLDERSDLPPLDPAYDASSGLSDAPASDGGAADQAKSAADTAQEQGAHVAQTAKEEAADVAEEAKKKAEDLLAEARQQVQEQSRTQLQALSSRLDELGAELQSMAAGSEQQGVMSDLAEQLADRAQRLGDHLDGRAPDALLEDVRSFARRRPGTFLLGAATAGLVAGRLARGAKASPSTTSADTPDGHHGLDRDGRHERRHVVTAPIEPGPEAREPADQRSLGAIVGDIADDLSTMVRSELELAKVEAKQEAVKAGKAGGAFGGAALSGFFALLFLSLFVMYLLDGVMDTAWAALIVFGLWALAAAALALMGRKKVQQLSNPMETTQANVKEDVQWATNRK